MSVYYLIYVSQARSGIDTADLESILSESRAYNPRHGITGLLLHASRSGSSGSFMQLLEGGEAAVERLRERIFSDPRHHTKVVLESGEKLERDFSNWSMAFRYADPQALGSHPAFANLGTPTFLAEAAEGRVKDSLGFLVEFWHSG